MSKPNWDALAVRFGAQEAEYAAPEPQHTDQRTICRSRGCGWLAEPGALYCRGCQEANRLNEQQRQFDLLAAARAHQDAGATQDGRALIAGTVWLAAVLVCAAITLAVFGAAWANMLWLAPFGGR